MGWHNRTNPVPLRSAFELWGRHGLTPREQRQVRTSNVLLIYAIAFATPSAICGIANWTEHPNLISRHAWLSAPSIWITEQLRRLQALPNVRAHHLQHCRFGGATRKPTRLLSVTMAVELDQAFKKFERPRAPTGCLIGKQIRWLMENLASKRIPESNERRNSSSHGKSGLQAPKSPSDSRH